MLGRYASCSTYQDSGFLENFLEGEERSQGRLLKFRTWYKKPYFFRFEWIDRPFPEAPWRENTIGCDGENAFSKYHYTGLKIQSSLKYAIAEANAASRNAVTQISQHFPDLDLLPIAWLDRHKDLTLIGQESANDKECYCVAATVKNPHDKIIWVDCDDFSLRRIKTYTKVATGISEGIMDLAKKVAPEGIEELTAEQKKEQRSYIETNYEEVAFDRDLPDFNFAQPE